MLSSICNFDAWRQAWRSPRRGRALGLAVGAAVVLWGGLALLRALFDAPDYTTLAVEALGPETTTLALGSSHVRAGIDPRILDAGHVNLSTDYLNAPTMVAAWHRHAARVPHLKLAVVELDVTSLMIDTLVMNPRGLSDLDLPLWGDFHGFVPVVRRLLLPALTWRLTPRFLESRKADGTPLVPGFTPSTRVAEDPEAFARKRILYCRTAMAHGRAGLFAESVASYLQLIRELDAAGVKVALLRLPLLSSVRHLYPSEWQASLDSTLQTLHAAGASFTYWDESDLPELVQSDFEDPDHLNEAGAAIFTRHLQAKMTAYLNL